MFKKFRKKKVEAELEKAVIAAKESYEEVKKRLRQETAKVLQESTNKSLESTQIIQKQVQPSQRWSV